MDGVVAALPSRRIQLDDVRIQPNGRRMDDHLTEERAEPPVKGASQAPNRRNGNSQKAVTTGSGKVVLGIPRDRSCSFDPMLIAKYQLRFAEFDTKIISMYARGITA